jgi:hypothetical protein
MPPEAAPPTMKMSPPSKGGQRSRRGREGDVPVGT